MFGKCKRCYVKLIREENYSRAAERALFEKEKKEMREEIEFLTAENATLRLMIEKLKDKSCNCD